MGHGILSVKLCELDEAVCRLHGRIHLSESRNPEELDEEIARAERDLYELKSAVSGKLRFSQSAAVSRISRKYMAVEEALRSAASDDVQPSSDERLLIAEYYLDFAMLAAEKAVLESLMAIRSSMDEERRK